MILSKYVAVAASFDSGTFKGFSVTANNPTSYNDNDTNIQAVYNLSYEDFTTLEILIASTVGNYLKGKV